MLTTMRSVIMFCLLIDGSLDVTSKLALVPSAACVASRLNEVVDAD